MSIYFLSCVHEDIRESLRPRIPFFFFLLITEQASKGTGYGVVVAGERRRKQTPPAYTP